MPIEVIDKLKPKNNMNFPVAESNDLRGGVHCVNTFEEMETIPQDKREIGMFCYVKEYPDETKTFQLTVDGWVLARFGGGGEPTNPTPTITVLNKQPSFNYEEPVKFLARATSPNKGDLIIKCTFKNLTLNENEITITKEGCKAGVYTEFFLNERRLMTRGEYAISFYAIDSQGVVSQEAVDFTFKIGSLEINSTFKQTIPIDVTTPSIKIPYSIACVEGNEKPITVRISVDNQTPITLENQVVGDYEFELPPQNKIEGYHTIKFSAETETLTSSDLILKAILVSAQRPTVIAEDVGECEYGMPIDVQYKVYMLNYIQPFNVTITRAGLEPISAVVRGGETAFASINPKPYLPVGEYSVTIQAATIDNSIHSTPVVKNFKIKASDYTLLEPTLDGIWFNYDASHKNNQQPNKGVWEDSSGNNFDIELNNFNFSSNGWLKNEKGETYLKLNGKCWAQIPIQPFNKLLGVSPNEGFTFEMVFRTKNIGDMDAKVVDCLNPMTPYQGFYVTTREMQIGSTTTKQQSPVEENVWTHVAFIVSKKPDFLTMTTMVDGVVVSIQDIDIAEDFQMDKFIYLNTGQVIQDSQGTHLFNQGECDIRLIRGYRRALSFDECTDNWMSTISDLVEQKAKFELNKGVMDTVIFHGNVFELTNPKAKPPSAKPDMDVDIEFIGYKSGLPRWKKNFNIKWQGTSTLNYPVKNYKIKLTDTKGSDGEDTYEKYIQAHPTWFAEKTFTLKADFMESSHMSNTSGCKFAHSLYDDPIPPQLELPQTRSCIDGFPVRVMAQYIDPETNQEVTTDMGIYQFNLDKNSAITLGFEKVDPITNKIIKSDSVWSFEVAANTAGGAGSFGDSSLSSIDSEFEVRYSNVDEDAVSSHPEFCSFVKWVVDIANQVAEKRENGQSYSALVNQFKAEAPQHLNIPYTLDYLLMTYLIGSVDNLGKNMMLTTWDKNIYYPCFYDLDTNFGVTNGGVYGKITPDADIVDGLFFTRTLDVAIPNDIGVHESVVPEIPAGVDPSEFPLHRINQFNTYSSGLWILIRLAFEKELRGRYADLRSNKFKFENIMKHYEDNGTNLVGEKLYNKEYLVKYRPHPEHVKWFKGNRRLQRRDWLKKRMAFTDTVFGYGASQTPIYVKTNYKSEKAVIGIRSASPILVTVDFGNDDGDPLKTTVTKYVSDKEFTYFSGSIKTSTDREVSISCAGEIVEIDKLEDFRCSMVQIGGAKKLTNLNLSNNGFVQEVDFNNPNMQYINLRKCTSLKKGIDVSYCPNLREINCEESTVPSIKFVSYDENNPSVIKSSAGSIQNLKIAGSAVTELRLVNQSFLDNIDLEGCRSVGILQIENCIGFKNFTTPSQHSLSKIEIGNCENMTSIVVDKSTDLTEFNLGYLPKLEMLSLKNCSRLTQLDLTACPALTTINASISGVRYVRLPANSTSVKNLYFNNSSIAGIKRGVGEIPDIVDVTGLTLRDFVFYQCVRLKEVKGLNLVMDANSNSTLFNESGGLTSVSGSIRFKTHANSTFRGTATTVFPTMYTRELTSAGATFQSTYISTSAAKNFILNSPNLASCSTTFYGCRGLSGTLPDDFFKTTNEHGTEVASKITSTYRMFESSNLAGISSNVLSKLPALTSAQRMFYNCTSLIGTMPYNFFYNNTKLSNLEYMFYNCDNYNVNLSKVENISGQNHFLGNLIFSRLPLLNNTYGLFYECAKVVGSIRDCEDMFKNNTSLSNVSMMFRSTPITGQVQSGFFANNPALTSTYYMFANSRGVGGLIKPDLFANNSRLVNVGYMFYNTTTAGELPPTLFDACTQLKEVQGFVRKTDVSGQIPENWFARTNVLTNVSELFMECPNLTHYVPAKLLHGQPNLLFANGLYQGCSGLNTFPEGFAIDATKVGIPEKLFKDSHVLKEAARVFQGCSKITRIKGNVFERENLNIALNVLSTIAGAFKDCSELALFPNNEMVDSFLKGCESVLDASYLFDCCVKLSCKISKNLFYPLEKAQKMNHIFRLCHNMYDESDVNHEYIFPVELFSKCLAVQTLESAFDRCGLKGKLHGDMLKNCSKLTTVKRMFYAYWGDFAEDSDGRTEMSGELPADLFETWGEDDRGLPIEPQIKDFSYCFWHNTGLTGFEEGFMRSNTIYGINFTETFNHNSGLRGVAPKLWEGRSGTTNTKCFGGCSNLSNYVDIPDGWK